MAENNIEKRLEARQAVQDAKFDAFMQEMRDFKTEMRQQNEMRAAELRELRQKQDADAEAFRQAQAAQQAKHDTDIKELRNELDRKVENLSNDIKEVSNEVKGIGKEVRNLFLTAAIGIGAMFATIIYT